VTAGEIITGDCLEVLPQVPQGGADLVVIHPPYNLGVKYDAHDDAMRPDDYLDWCRRWVSEAAWSLREGGALWLAIGDEWACQLDTIAREQGFLRRDWVVWYYKFGNYQEGKFGRNKTHLFYYTNGGRGQITWNRDAIREPSLRQTKYGDKRANPRGRVPGNVWEFPRVCGTFKERAGGHPCQMNAKVLERIVLACSNPGDLVLDPMCGAAATTLVAAKRLGRRWLGVEISPAYAEAARVRLAQTEPLSIGA
jgi:DNA modification methylase